MISPERARRRIARHAQPLSPVRLPIDKALGHLLAENVRAKIDMPRFDNTAMDGYAFAIAGYAGGAIRPAGAFIAPRDSVCR